MNIFAVYWNPCVSLSQNEKKDWIMSEIASHSAQKENKVLCQNRYRPTFSMHFKCILMEMRFGRLSETTQIDMRKWDHMDNGVCKQKNGNPHTQFTLQPPAARRMMQKYFRTKRKNSKTVSVANFGTLCVWKRKKKLV